MAELPALIGLVQKCRQKKSLAHAQQLLTYLHQHRLESHPVLGNFLVPLLVDCGSLAEAQLVFDQLPHRNEHSWSSLISGYIDFGDPRYALHLYHKMQEESLQPNSYAFVALLQACTSLKDAEVGRGFHAKIVEQGLDKHLFIGNTLVDMYGKCGLVADANNAFAKIPTPNIVSWNALIAAWNEKGLGEEALRCIDQLQLDTISPNAVTFVCSLKACGIVGAGDRGQLICAEITKLGLEANLFIGNSMVDMFSKCGMLLEARNVFENLNVRDSISWNALIAGYSEHGPAEEALTCYEQMQQEDQIPEVITFTSMLKACGNVGTAEQGLYLCTEIFKRGFERDIFVGSSMVDMHFKLGSLNEAQVLFNRLSIRNAVLWNVMLTGYAEHGCGEEALGAVKQMQLEGIPPDAVTLACSLKACAVTAAFETGQQVHTEVIKRGFEREIFVCNTLVDMYFKCSLLPEAQEVFEALLVRDAVSWAALISGYAEHSLDEEVLKAFKRMRLDGASADDITYVHCLKSCGTLGAVETGLEIHAVVEKLAVESDFFVSNTLIDMYGKCGLLAEGRKVFDRMPIRNVVSWNALIKSYGENHACEMAIQCFKEMQEQGLKPDATTFTCLLVACSHASLVLEGQEYFNVMNNYAIRPMIEQFTSMIDLFARSGNVYEAQKFMEAVQCILSEDVLIALLSACKSYGKAELGLKCFQHLVQVNQEEAAAYLLLAHIYASTGRLSDAQRIEKVRKHAGARKKAATALIEVNKKLHEFVKVEDQSKNTLVGMNMLTSLLKDKGYVPIMS